MWPGLSLARCQLVTTATTTRASRVATGQLCLHAVAITPAGLMELRSLVLSHQRRPAHITRGEGSCVNRFEACSAFTSRYGLHARQVTYVTLYTGGSDGFVSSTAAPIASGWSEPSSRAGLSPAVDQRLFTAHV
jgi:hypothetical protein